MKKFFEWEYVLSVAAACLLGLAIYFVGVPSVFGDESRQELQDARAKP